MEKNRPESEKTVQEQESQVIQQEEGLRVSVPPSVGLRLFGE